MEMPQRGYASNAVSVKNTFIHFEFDPSAGLGDLDVPPDLDTWMRQMSEPAPSTRKIVSESPEGVTFTIPEQAPSTRNMSSESPEGVQERNDDCDEAEHICKKEMSIKCTWDKQVSEGSGKNNSASEPDQEPQGTALSEPSGPSDTEFAGRGCFSRQESEMSSLWQGDVGVMSSELCRQETEQCWPEARHQSWADAAVGSQLQAQYTHTAPDWWQGTVPMAASMNVACNVVSAAVPAGSKPKHVKQRGHRRKARSLITLAQQALSRQQHQELHRRADAAPTVPPGVLKQASGRQASGQEREKSVAVPVSLQQALQKPEEQTAKDVSTTRGKTVVVDPNKQDVAPLLSTPTQQEASKPRTAPKFCPYCGGRCRENSKFCTFCAAPLAPI
jgi:hypothetical protein